MSGQARRTVAWVTGVVVVVVVTGFVAPVLLVPPADAPLASVLLDNRDVGAIEPGFRRELSRATEEPVPLPEWIPSSVRRVAQVPTHRNEWAAPDRGRTIVVVGHRLQLPVLASAVFDGLVRTATAHAAREVTIAAVPGARGFIEAPNGPGDPARRYVAILQQGTLVLTVVVSASDIADDRDLHLAERLMQKQSAKVPETRSAPVMTSDSELAVWSAAGTLLALLTYLSLASLIAWRSDPLRRGRRAPASLAAPRPAGTPANPAVDVTSAANRQRRAAQVWTTIELAGFAVAAPGAFPFTWPTGLVVVAVGTAMAGLAAILRSDRRNHPFQPERLPRRRRIRMIFYSAVSALCVFCGLVGLLLYGIGGFVASQLLIRNVAIAGIGIVFVAAGTLLFRHTRRLAVSTAREALRADLRPAVLYLRAFADDALRLRSARYARPLLLERLSPRGFDRFEEAIVRSLSAVGPSSRSTRPARGWRRWAPRGKPSTPTNGSLRSRNGSVTRR